MKKIILLVIVLISYSCEQQTTTTAKWDASKEQVEANDVEDFEIGDVVRFNHEDSVLGTVNYIRCDEKLDVYYRDGRGKVHDITSINFKCVKKVKEQK
jgi:hypothetical protein